MNSISKILLVALLVVTAGLVGWKLGQPNKSNSGNADNQTTPNSPPEFKNSQSDVKSLVSYTLPDGWSESTCPSSSETVYIVPAGTKADCSADPSSPIKISVDAQGATDCNQLQNVQNVRKHICSSLFINDHKTLKALTEYSRSEYSQEKSVAAYHLDSGKGVVKVEYIFNSDNRFEAGFNGLANSLKVK